MQTDQEKTPTRDEANGIAVADEQRLVIRLILVVALIAVAVLLLLNR
jgi:hypothetical protein